MSTELFPTFLKLSNRQVLVVGGGPSGAACAYWLADAGHDVLLLEKKHYPREKTCGDGLTPRSVKQLHDIGLAAIFFPRHSAPMDASSRSPAVRRSCRPVSSRMPVLRRFMARAAPPALPPGAS